MAIAVAQEVQGQDPNFSTNGTTIAATITVASGSCLHVAAFANGSSGLTASVSDGTNTYTAIGNVFQSGKAFHWSTGPVSSGTLTLTVTFGATVNLKGIIVREITGSSGYQSIHAENALTTPGTGTDAITSGSMTPASQPALISALCVDTFFGATPTAGTGFTSSTGAPLLGKCWDWGDGTANSYCRLENQRIISTSSTAATFTSSAGAADKFCVLAAIFTESGGAVAQNPRSSWNSTAIQQWEPEDQQPVRRSRQPVSAPAAVRTPYQRPRFDWSLYQDPTLYWQGIRSALVQAGASNGVGFTRPWLATALAAWEPDPITLVRSRTFPVSAPAVVFVPFAVRRWLAVALDAWAPVDQTSMARQHFPLPFSISPIPPTPPVTPANPFDWRADDAAIIGQMFRGGGFSFQV